MSKSLKLAQEIHRTGRKLTDAERNGLTVQEGNLLLQVGIFLERSTNSASPFKSWEDCETVARALDAGGVLDDPFVQRMSHRAAFESNAETARKALLEGVCFAHTPGIDDVAAANICHQALSDLKQCSIRDLLRSSKGVPRCGYFVKVRVIEPSFQVCSIQSLVEDMEGTVITLALYNFIALYGQRDYVDEVVPVGAILTIKDPYLKLSNFGNLALRVDNPCNVIIDKPVAKTLSVLALKVLGNGFFAKGQHASAIDVYSKGLASCEQLKVDLHSNRAAAHLRVGDWDAAVTDCNVVLSSEPAHAKATARLEEALRNLATTPSINLETAFDSMAIGTSASDDVSSSCPDELKATGNTLFKSKNFLSARRFYSAALAALASVQIALFSNRSASRLTTGSFIAAVADCDAVLAMDPTHTKALARKAAAMAGAATETIQSGGTFDFLTLPHNPRFQDRVANFFGPIVIRSAGTKGRGLFAARDVQAGELLLVEKAVGYMLGDAMKTTHATNWATRTVKKGSTFELETDLIIAANVDPAVNAQLSYLVYDNAAPNTILPDIDWFRQRVFPPVDTLSAKRVSAAVALNCFSFSMPPEPTQTQRCAMEAACHSGDRMRFGLAFVERMAQQRREADSKPKYAQDGTALWVVASFMNHSSHNSVMKEFYGKLMFVYAADDLKAGDELTTVYCDDKKALKRTWGIDS